MGVDQLVTGGDVNDPVVDSLTTDEQNVTDETLVLAKKTSDQTINSGSNEVVTWDTEDKDERNEFDKNNNKFSPDTTGWYFVAVQVRFAVGSDGDLLRVRFRNSTDGNTILKKVRETGGTELADVLVCAVLKLNSAKSYKADVQNFNSSDTIKGNEDATIFSIRSVFRQ